MGCLAVSLKPRFPQRLIQVSKKPHDSAYSKVETSSVDEDFHCNALTSAGLIDFLWQEMQCSFFDKLIKLLGTCTL